MDIKTRRTAFGSTLTAFAIIAALAAGLVALPLALGAQEASPEAESAAIAPIVWQLISFDDGAGTVTPVEEPARYTVQFSPGGNIFIGADCNRGVSSFELGEEGTLSIGEIATTLALCPEDSLSDQFLAALDQVASATIDQSGSSDQLVLGLGSGGELRFDPSLIGVVWEWQQFQGGDDSVIAPDDPSKYALEFQADGTVTGQVDCNRGMGSYEIGDDGTTIAILLATTRMMCPEGSLDADFLRFVSESTSFVIRDGNFSLSLPMDGGITTFSPVFDDPFAESETGS